jgi:hypothetical protein
MLVVCIGQVWKFFSEQVVSVKFQKQSRKEKWYGDKQR